MTLVRRNYICACDGLQEKLYLEHIGKLLTQFPARVVRFNAIVDGPARLSRQYEEYDRAALFDHDFDPKLFEKNILICEEMQRRDVKERSRSRRSTCHAYSNVNFDLWLVLHKENYVAPVASNHAYIEKVRQVYRLDREADIKKEQIIREIVEQISLQDVRLAIRRAEAIRQRKLEQDRKTVGQTSIYPNPDFSIHEFLRSVLQSVGEWNE